MNAFQFNFGHEMKREELPQPMLACWLAVLELAASAIYVSLACHVGVKQLVPTVTFQLITFLIA